MKQLISLYCNYILIVVIDINIFAPKGLLLIRVIRIITMKSINIALTEKAHIVLKALTEKHKKNQSEIVSEILEKVKVE